MKTIRKAAMYWPDPLPHAVQSEMHFGTRVLQCYVDRPTNAAELLQHARRTWPGAEALVDGARRYTYDRLASIVDNFAGNLHARGIGKGDRVGLFLGNSAEFVIAMLGCVRAGTPFVPISARCRAPEVVHALADSGARALVFGADQAAQLPATLPASVELTIGVDVNIGLSIAFGELLEPAIPQPLAIDEDDLFAVLYTSGTTGRPKGAMQTHVGTIHGAMQFADCWELAAGDRSILAVPGTHAAGIGVIFTMLRAGGCTIVMPQFNARVFLELAERERMSYAALVPAMYNLFLLESKFARFDLSAWRVGGYGAAPMTPATIAALANAMPHLQLVNAYGCTETTQPPLLMPLGRTAEHADSVGCVVPCAEVMIVNSQGRELLHGEVGEIWMRGPTIVPGYWNNPEADRAAFTDGWWHSGDVGSLDAQGYLKVLDRLKDMLIRGGYKVYSAEVENALALHPSVLECAVIGRADPVLGERVHAFVVLREPATSAEALHQWCARQLADYKVPESFTLMAAPLPRNQNGKVIKRALRDQLSSQTGIIT